MTIVPIFVILSINNVNFSVISHKIAEIMYVNWA